MGLPVAYVSVNASGDAGRTGFGEHGGPTKAKRCARLAQRAGAPRQTPMARQAPALLSAGMSS